MERDDAGGAPGGGRDEGESGVTGRLLRLVRSVASRVRRAFVPEGSRGEANSVRTDGDQTAAAADTAIRVGGQRQLTGERAAPPAVSKTQPPAVPGAAAKPTVRARLDDDWLRVYDSERPEAYIESDYWQQVEQ
jgi:hypothetical protein